MRGANGSANDIVDPGATVPVLKPVARDAIAEFGISGVVEGDGRREIQFQPFVAGGGISGVPARRGVAIVGFGRSIRGITLPKTRRGGGGSQGQAARAGGGE